MSELGSTTYGIEDRRKHLDMIQAVIARTASSSASTKGWQLPVVAAAYGYSVAQHAWTVALVGIGTTLLLASLDAHYVRQERAHRALFRAVADGDVGDYEMDTSRFLGQPNGDVGGQRHEDSTWAGVVSGWSIRGFYGPVLLAGLVAAVVAAAMR